MEKWSEQKLTDWALGNKHAWASELIRDRETDFPEHGDNGFSQFVTDTRWKLEDIDPDKVVGQWEHYSGQTWLEALTEPSYKPPKMNRYIAQTDADPEYYFSGDRTDMHFDSYDGGQTWYSSEGNHRTVIAKFLFAMYFEKTGNKVPLRQVTAQRTTVDWEAHKAYQEIKKCIDENKLPINISPQKTETASDYGFSSYALTFNVTDKRYPLGASKEMSRNEFIQYADWVVKGNKLPPPILKNWKWFYGVYSV